MWKISYTKDECDVDAVMDGLNIDRSAPSKMELTKIQMEQAKERLRATRNIPKNSDMYTKQIVKKDGQTGSDSDDESEASEGEDVDEC